MEGTYQLVVLAVLVESVVEWVKELIKAETRWPKLLAFSLSVLLLASLNLDIFSLLGMELSIPFLGTILLAFAVSRGANYVHDLLDFIKNQPRLKQ